MIDEASEATLKSVLASAVGEVVCRLDELQLRDEDFQNIKIQLRALGLIAKSNKARKPTEEKGFWTLTLYGDELMMQLRAIPSARKRPGSQ